MRSITFLDGRYPVKTIISDRGDWQSKSGWQEDDSRKSVIEDYLHTPLKRVIYARETHSGSVFSVSDNEDSGTLEAISEDFRIGPAGGYDAVVTAVPGILLCVWTADCIPLFLYDTVKHAAAVAHCGWRGVCGGIVENTLEAMVRLFGSSPENILAAFGPGICAGCYEVGSDLIEFFSSRFPRKELEELFLPKENGKWRLDLRKAVSFILRGEGIRAERIHDAGICSYEAEDFASYRRNGPSEASRQTLSGIVLL